MFKVGCALPIWPWNSTVHNRP